MTRIPALFALIAAAALAACTSPDRLGDGNTVDLSNPAQVSAAGAVNPDSPAYFTTAIGDRVHFAVDESTLSPEARQILQGQADWLLDHRDYNVLIEGHADEQGTREYNLALGARRASAVQQFLIAQGVAPERLRTVTYGKERPLEICSEEACYAKNRRAVSVLQAPTS